MASQGEGQTRRPPHDRRSGYARRRRGRGRSRRRHRRRGHVGRGQRSAEARHRRPPADHREHLHLRRLVQAAPARRAARRREPGDRLLRRDRTRGQAGRGGHRGPALLRAQGHRLRLDRTGAVHRPARRSHRAGRLDHHPAVHQERLPAAERAHSRHHVAQAPRSGARLPAREALVQGRDPHQLPEHHLLRRERLRHRDGGAHVLRHAARPASPCRRRPCWPASSATPAATTRSPTRRPPGPGAPRCSTPCARKG